MAEYVRISGDPLGDLASGVSYTGGAHGEAAQAHAGLSCYSTSAGLGAALEKLEAMLGLAGRGADGAERYLIVLAGRAAGLGPEGEDLCADARIVAQVSTDEISGAGDEAIDAALARLAERGVREE